MSADFVALLKRRVYVALVTDKNIKVRWNGELVPVKNFQQYIDLFIGAKDEAPRVYEADGERWEYAVALAPNDEFQQVSFVMASSQAGWQTRRARGKSDCAQADNIHQGKEEG